MIQQFQSIAELTTIFQERGGQAVADFANSRMLGVFVIEELREPDLHNTLSALARAKFSTLTNDPSYFYPHVIQDMPDQVQAHITDTISFIRDGNTVKVSVPLTKLEPAA